MSKALNIAKVNDFIVILNMIKYLFKQRQTKPNIFYDTIQSQDQYGLSMSNIKPFMGLGSAIPVHDAETYTSNYIKKIVNDQFQELIQPNMKNCRFEHDKMMNQLIDVQNKVISTNINRQPEPRQKYDSYYKEDLSNKFYDIYNKLEKTKKIFLIKKMN